MAFDGVAISCICHELQQLCGEGRVDKILQPERDEICLVIRGAGKTYRLLASASSANPRVHLTDYPKENPMVAPMFCMLLRKHLSSGRIVGFEQPQFERVLRIMIESRNELGDLSIKSLYVEIMSRHSNIVLTDGDQKILGSIKHVDFSVSSVRQLIPGMVYELPPTQNKQNPLCADVSEIKEMVNSFEGGGDKLLMERFTGIGPMTARELVYQAFGTATVDLALADDNGKERFAAQVAAAFRAIGQHQYQPELLYKNGADIWEFSAIHIGQYEQAAVTAPRASLNQAADEYYYTKDLQERIRQKTADLMKFVDNNIARCQKKLALQQQKIKDCESKERDKQYGDLITANLYRIEEGAAVAAVENYYDDNKSVSIPLTPGLTPSQNAQKYYTRYQKAKTAEVMTAQQMRLAETELDYLESVKEALQLADCEKDIREIREELLSQGYLVRSGKGKATKKVQAAKPLEYQLLDGFTLLVGKNNAQNDQLTLRESARNDLWFHTKLIHGSHAVIRTGGRTPPDDVIVQAAKICAYYSKARNSANVPVDYTLIKNVKKPSGAKPGMVIYENYQTVNVTPALPEEK